MGRPKNPELAVAGRVLKALESLPPERRAPLLDFLAGQIRAQRVLDVPTPKDPRQTTPGHNHGGAETTPRSDESF